MTATVPEEKPAPEAPRPHVAEQSASDVDSAWLYLASVLELLDWVPLAVLPRREAMRGPKRVTTPGRPGGSDCRVMPPSDGRVR